MISEFLPSRFRFSAEKDILSKYYNSKLGEIIKAHRLNIEPANVLTGPRLLMRLLNETVTCDQYHIKNFIKEGSVIIDAGANIGIFSIFASILMPTSKIFAFEPVREIYDVLVKNVKGYTNVDTHNLALGDKTGEGEIIIDKDKSIRSRLIDSEMNSRAPISRGASEIVGLTTIDGFAEKNKVSRIDFIKIDAEGYERQIIKGAELIIKKFSPVIAVSAYHLVDDKEKIPALIKTINPAYHCELSKGGGEEVFIFWP